MPPVARCLSGSRSIVERSGTGLQPNRHSAIVIGCRLGEHTDRRQNASPLLGRRRLVQNSDRRVVAL